MTSDEHGDGLGSGVAPITRGECVLSTVLVLAKPGSMILCFSWLLAIISLINDCPPQLRAHDQVSPNGLRRSHRQRVRDYRGATPSFVPREERRWTIEAAPQEVYASASAQLNGIFAGVRYLHSCSVVHGDLHWVSFTSSCVVRAKTDFSPLLDNLESGQRSHLFERRRGHNRLWTQPPLGEAHVRLPQRYRLPHDTALSQSARALHAS